jgi:hypothetical protein
MIATLWAGLAWAISPDPQVEAALTAELERAVSSLRLPDAPPLYLGRAHWMGLEQLSAQASLGSLVQVTQGPSHLLGVELRLGSPAFDNTGFGGWEDGRLVGGLPAQPTPLAAARDAWDLLDRAYKQAVEQYARKEAQFTRPSDYPGDWWPLPAQAQDLGAASASPAPPLLERLRQASAGFSPNLLRGEAHLGHEAGFHLLIDTDGTRLVRPLQETSLRLVGQVRAPDGRLLTDQRLFVRGPAGDLPDGPALARAAAELEAHLLAVQAAPLLDEEYVGPVLFDGAAAADLVRWLLVPQLQGTPSEIAFDTSFGRLGAQRDPVRVGRRVLPPGFRAVDDPLDPGGHPWSFAFDFEGTPAERTVLVEEGVVTDLLLSRTPRAGATGSNGHARGYVGQAAQAHASHLQVAAPRALSRAALVRLGLRQARAYGRDWFLVVERLQEPAVIELGSNFWYDDDQPLPPTVSLTRVYADGREELLGPADFASGDRFLLRDVLAAGGSSTWEVLVSAEGRPSGLGPVEGLATRITAPALLIGEVEFVASQGDPRDAARLRPRW